MRYHIVDAFADDAFDGNPAAVVVGATLPGPEVMQRAAARIGLPTTAFVAPAGPGEYRIRWYTPFAEINLCGHATIASAAHLFGLDADAARTHLRFVSPGGELVAGRRGGRIVIELATAGLTLSDPPPGLLDALGLDAVVCCAVSHDDVVVEVGSAAVVAGLRPDFAALARMPVRGHVVTARGTGSGVDFVSRTFFPALGVDEDQVCVSAHCKLTPYWSRRLGRSRLTALQLSERGGRLELEDAGDRIRVLATAVPRGGVRELVEAGST